MRKLLPVLALASGIASCASDEAAPAASSPLRYELFPWTRELDPGTLAAVRDVGLDDGVVRFRGSPPQLAGLKPGDIVLAGRSQATPSGLLRQVVEVQSDDQGTVLRCKPAPIQLAFRTLHAR